MDRRERGKESGGSDIERRERRDVIFGSKNVLCLPKKIIINK